MHTAFCIISVRVTFNVTQHESCSLSKYFCDVIIAILWRDVFYYNVSLHKWYSLMKVQYSGRFYSGNFFTSFYIHLRTQMGFGKRCNNRNTMNRSFLFEDFLPLPFFFFFFGKKNILCIDILIIYNLLIYFIQIEQKWIRYKFHSYQHRLSL